MTETQVTLPVGLIRWQRNWHIRFNPFRENWTLWANSRNPTKLVAEMTPKSLTVYLVQLENLPHDSAALLPVQHSGFYRIFLPNVGPGGLIPKNIHFQGYVSPFTKQAWGGIANKFHNLSDVYKFIRAYPDLISRLFNQAPMVYAEPNLEAKELTYHD